MKIKTTRYWIKKVGERALCKLPTLQMTYSLSCHCIDFGVPGCFVECGVFAGVHPAIMAQACIDKDERPRRIIRLFDSFQGIPKASPEDGPSGLIIEGESVCTIEQVKGHMKEWQIPDHHFSYHPGWFHTTLPEVGKFDIAFLRIDCDLYESTKLVLKYLYPRIVPGGICVVDDSLPGCVRAVNEMISMDDRAPMIWQRGQK